MKTFKETNTHLQISVVIKLWYFLIGCNLSGHAEISSTISSNYWKHTYFCNITCTKWLMLVSEANCIKQPQRWFLPLFLISEWGNNKGNTVNLYYHSKPCNHGNHSAVTRAFTFHCPTILLCYNNGSTSIYKSWSVLLTSAASFSTGVACFVFCRKKVSKLFPNATSLNCTPRCCHNLELKIISIPFQN